MNIRKIIGKMGFAYLGLDVDCDPYFNNNQYNWKPNSSIGLVFGFNNEVVYHHHLSAIHTFKLYNNLMINLERYEDHPFEKGVRMNIEDFISIRNIRITIHNGCTTKCI